MLEVYLNSIELDPGIFGIQEAVRSSFDKDAADLTRSEAALIAAILPAPSQYQANPRTAYIEKRKNWILQQMRFFGDFPVKNDKKRQKKPRN